MRQIITQQYRLTGWSSVLIYSEQEMADALNLSCDELRQAIRKGLLGYHAHPLSNAMREYQFTKGAFDQNIAMWQCIKNGGHHFEFDHYYDERQGKAMYRCQNCPAEKWD